MQANTIKLRLKNCKLLINLQIGDLLKLHNWRFMVFVNVKEVGIFEIKKEAIAWKCNCFFKF